MGAEEHDRHARRLSEMQEPVLESSAKATEGTEVMSDDRWKTDTEYEDQPIAEVRCEGDGKYSVKRADGWSIGWQCDFEPKVGDNARYFGRGVGYTVRGIVYLPLDGSPAQVVRYQTDAEDRAERDRLMGEDQERRERDFLATQTDTDRRIDALPTIFRERMLKFQRDGGHDYRRDYEGYELFCVEQAVVIADALQTPEAIDHFHRLNSWAEQKEAVPGLDGGHSGNTFGCACSLAKAYVTNPEFVTKMHGALTPLVGCEEYGCKHPAEKDSL